MIDWNSKKSVLRSQQILLSLFFLFFVFNVQPSSLWALPTTRPVKSATRPTQQHQPATNPSNPSRKEQLKKSKARYLHLPSKIPHPQPVPSDEMLIRPTKRGKKLLKIPPSSLPHPLRRSQKGHQPIVITKEKTAARAAIHNARSKNPPPSSAKKKGSGPFVEALLLNGGGSPRSNYYSHLLYLHLMRQVLQERGLDDKAIVIFNADGEEPEKDLLINQEKTRLEHWIFRFRPEHRFFRQKGKLINTSIRGKKLHPAKLEEFREHLIRAARRFQHSKKPFFIFVTDHGTRNSRVLGGRNNYISLWRDKMSVRQYQLAFRALKNRPIISVMSQCFSGSFAWAIYRKPGRFGIPTGHHCGFFATLPNRFAYGCFPTTRLKKQVGHAYRFILAMRRAKTLDEAHREVLLSDKTPDVPLRTSDAYLLELLQGDAQADGLRPDAYVDHLLKKYEKKNYAGKKEDLQLIGAIAYQFGLSRPFNLSALRAQEDALWKKKNWYERAMKMWRSAFRTARDLHLNRWLEHQPQLRRSLNLFFKNPRLYKKYLRERRERRRFRRLENWRRRRFTRQLLKIHRRMKRLRRSLSKKDKNYARKIRQLRKYYYQFKRLKRFYYRKYRSHRRSKAQRQFANILPLWRLKYLLKKNFLLYVESRPQLKKRLQLLYTKMNQMKQAAFNVQVQLAALKRMEILFYRIAGRLFLEHTQNEELKAHRKGLMKLLKCEQTSLGTPPPLMRPRRVEKFMQEKELPLPSWFGIAFDPIGKRFPALPRGSVIVRNVYLRTPAAAAGIRVGDKIVAIEGQQLREPYEIRERIMLAPSDKITHITLVRHGELFTLPVRLRRLTRPPALRLPPLIGRWSPPLVGAPLPSRSLRPHLKRHLVLLLFWATWCYPCKASLPTLRSWKKRFYHRGLRIVAISRQRTKLVKRWLLKHKNDLPFYNINDETGKLHAFFRIRATPTFVLIDRGRIVYYSIGFRRSKMDRLKRQILRRLKR